MILLDILHPRVRLLFSSCTVTGVKLYSRFTKMARKRDKLPDSAIAQVVQMHKSEGDLVRHQVLSDNKCLQTVAGDLDGYQDCTWYRSCECHVIF